MYPGPNIRVIVRPMGKIRYSRSLSGQSRVHCFSDRNDPRTPFHWPARAAPRRWPHFRRVHPIVATQLPKSTRFLYPPTRKWPVMHGHFDQQPTLSSSRFMLSPLPTAVAMNHPCGIFPCVTLPLPIPTAMHYARGTAVVGTAVVTDRDRS